MNKQLPKCKQIAEICKQTVEICKQTAEICKETAVKNVNNQLFLGASFLDAIYRTKLS